MPKRSLHGGFRHFARTLLRKRVCPLTRYPIPLAFPALWSVLPSSPSKEKKEELPTEQYAAETTTHQPRQASGAEHLTAQSTAETTTHQPKQSAERREEAFFSLEQQGTRTIARPRLTPDLADATLLDLLRYLPRITLSPQGIPLLGAEPLQLYIDQKLLLPEEITLYLCTIKASHVERIDIDPSPSPHHGGNTSANGILHITTRPAPHGVKGSADLYLSTPERGYYTLTPALHLSIGAPKWHIYSHYTYLRGRGKQESENTLRYLHNGNEYQSQSEQITHIGQHSYRIGGVASLLPRHTFGLDINGIYDAPRPDLIESVLHLHPKRGIPSTGRGQQKHERNSHFYSLAGYYRWALDARESFVKALVSLNGKKSHLAHHLTADLLSAMPSKYLNEWYTTQTQGHNWGAQLDGCKNWEEGWQINFGGQYAESRRTSQYFVNNTPTLPSIPTQHWLFRERTADLYIGGAKAWGDRLLLQLTLRGSMTLSEGSNRLPLVPFPTAPYHSQHGLTSSWIHLPYPLPSERVTYSYLEGLPSLRFSHRVGEQFSYAIAYERSLYRPPFILMNGYISRQSERLFELGNPHLRAEASDLVTLSATYGGHTASLQYRHTPKAITEYFNLFEEEVYHTHYNHTKVHALTLDYNFSGAILSWWQTNLYLMGNYTNIPNSLHRKALFGAMISWNNLLVWQGVGAFAVDVDFETPRIYGHAFQEGGFETNLSYSRSLWDNRLSLQVGITDLFNTSDTSITHRLPHLAYLFESKTQSRAVWCKLSYHFGKATESPEPLIDEENPLERRL